LHENERGKKIKQRNRKKKAIAQKENEEEETILYRDSTDHYFQLHSNEYKINKKKEKIHRERQKKKMKTNGRSDFSLNRFFKLCSSNEHQRHKEKEGMIILNITNANIQSDTS
jgi:hypothetical protein